jgi:hypothetical protein
VAADSSVPLRRAQVRASAPELRETRFTMTDAQGRYELKALPAGRYTLTVSKGNYVTLQYGQVRPFEPGRPVQIGVGEVLDHVDVALPRGSVLAGRVLDEFGEPIVSAIVRPLRYRYVAGQRRLMNGGPPGPPVQTNDLGEYRVFGLSPGQYYLAATVRNLFGGESEDRSAYAPTYYPSTTNAAEAPRVTVGVGQQVSDLTIVLSPVRTAQVSGTAVDADSRPLAGQSVVLYQRSIGIVGGTAEIKPDGSFVVVNVPPGDYVVATENDSGARDPRESAMAPLTVSGDDIVGVRLVGQEPAILSGRVVVDVDASRVPPAGTRVLVEAARFDENWFGGSVGRVDENGAFQIKARPGLAIVRVDNLSPKWALKAVIVNGIDLADAGLELRTGEEVRAVQVIVSERVSNISGAVADENGRPTKDYSAIVFAVDRERRGFASRYTAVGRPDQDGRFNINGMPSGEYFAVAVNYVEQGAQYDPELLEQLQSKATRFVLAEGDRQSLALKVTHPQ